MRDITVIIRELLEIWNIPINQADVSMLNEEFIKSQKPDIVKLYEKFKSSEYTQEKLNEEISNSSYIIIEFLDKLIMNKSVNNQVIFGQWEICRTVVQKLFLLRPEDEEYSTLWDELTGRLEKEVDFHVNNRIATAQYAADWMTQRLEPIKSDYVNLNARLNDQYDLINAQKKQSNKLEKTYQKLNKEIHGKNFNNNMEKITQSTSLYNEAKNMAQNTMNTSMTVLGIFVTIVVTIFGSMELMDSIGMIENISFGMFVFYLLFIFTATLNIIYLLLHTLSRISGKDIAGHCKKFDPDPVNKKKWENAFENFDETQNNRLLYFQCHCCKRKDKCSLVKKMMRKYPYVFYPDMALMSALIVIVALNIHQGYMNWTGIKDVIIKVNFWIFKWRNK